MNIHDGVTLGGWVVGMGLVVLNVVTWWPGLAKFRKDVRRQLLAIGPFILCWCYGALLIMCAGGLLGWIADVALWGTNWIGDGALVWGVGGQAQDNVARGTAQVLTNGGHAMVVLMIFVIAALLRRGRVDTGQVWQGLASGVTLGLSGGVVGWAAVPLASAANISGAWLSTGVLR